MQTLKNDFHGTSAKVRDVGKALEALGTYDPTTAQKRMARRLRTALCGAPESCSCGIVRGEQED